MFNILLSPPSTKDVEQERERVGIHGLTAGGVCTSKGWFHSVDNHVEHSSPMFFLEGGSSPVKISTVTDCERGVWFLRKKITLLELRAWQ